jgi:hypothetical protein
MDLTEYRLQRPPGQLAPFNYPVYVLPGFPRATVTATRSTTWNVGATAGPYTISGNLGTLVGADFAAGGLTVRLTLAGGTPSSGLPTATVDSNGSFSLAGIPTSVGGSRYCLIISWRTGVPDAPVQTITLDRLQITADKTLTALLP